MRVIMLNRPDACSAWGGDTTQMMETRHALVALGIEADIELAAEPALTGRGYDVAHIFNIQTAQHGMRQLRSARAAGLPVVLSTIYWDMRPVQVPAFFEHHPRRAVRAVSKIHWRLAAGALNALKALQDLRLGHPALALLRQADRLLPNSHAEAEVLAQHFNAPWVRMKAQIVPNGVRWPQPADSVVELPMETALPCVLQVAKVDPVKGQLRLIEALMVRPDLPLVFVGRGLDTSYGRACQALGARRGNTHFVGELPPEHVGAWYRRARVHVLPSLRESPGLASLEAAIFGANCVVSCHGPITEYFGPNAWTCDPNDSASVRAAVLAAWDAPNDGALTRRVLAHFTWNHAAEATAEAYRHVLAAGPRAINHAH